MIYLNAFLSGAAIFAAGFFMGRAAYKAGLRRSLLRLAAITACQAPGLCGSDGLCSPCARSKR